MDSSFQPTSGVMQAVLLIFALLPPLSRIPFTLIRRTLRSSWEPYRSATPLKQDKSARNLCKALSYILVFIALLPISAQILYFWLSNSFTTPLSTFSPSYVRIVLAIVPAYYIFELVTEEPLDMFVGLHHGIVLIMVPLVLTSVVTKTVLDASYLTNFTVFVAQTFSANFLFFMGHAFARVLPNSRRRYTILFCLAAYQFILTITLQVVMWVYFGASVARLTGWLPIAMTVSTATGLFVENIHTGWVTLSMAKKVMHATKREERFEKGEV